MFRRFYALKRRTGNHEVVNEIIRIDGT